MKIAICIPTYNQAQYLPIAVESALMQSGVEPEVWIADDNSTDDTAKVAARYKSNPRVHYYRNSTNFGISANVDSLLRKPEAEFILRLDSDDILMPEYCKILVGYLKEYPLAGVAHAAVQEVDAKGKYRRKRHLARRIVMESAENALKASRLGYKVAANICLFRAEALKQVNYTAGRPNYVEDWDLYTRLADNGWGNVYSPRILGQYRVWSDAGGYRQGRKATELSGMIRLFEETLEPAWEHRGWDVDELTKSRRALAINHVRALKDIPKESEDYLRVYKLLCHLANNEIVIKDSFSRLNSPIGKFSARLTGLKSTARDLLKGILYHKK